MNYVEFMRKADKQHREKWKAHPECRECHDTGIVPTMCHLFLTRDCDCRGLPVDYDFCKCDHGRFLQRLWDIVT